MLLLAAGGMAVALSAGERRSPAVPVAARPIAGDVREFMRGKIEGSRQIVEGIGIEDFALITTGAEQMIEMSKGALWQHVQSPEYVHDTSDFVSSAEYLIARAKHEDIDGAALAYAQLTLACVRCHKHVRSPKVATRESDPRARSMASAVNGIRAVRRAE
jgi:hypothetical protein